MAKATEHVDTEENTDTTDIAIQEYGPGGAGRPIAVGGKAFKIKQQVSLPVLKQADNVMIYVRFEGTVYQGEVLEGAKKKPDGTPEMDAARLARVTNLENNMLSLIIVNKVLEGELVRAYPNNTYVGKHLSIMMQPGPEGKRYKTFSIWELEPDAA